MIRRFASFCLLLSVALICQSARAENKALNSAINSITSADLKSHVDVLADDTFEGREAGSRGGRAAAMYLMKRYEKCGLKPAGTNAGYFQSFGAGYRNILGILEGRDPQLKDELIVIGAHFDHVGYGTRTNSYGPVGYIHNGADDNASGTAGLLEIIEAFTSLDQSPRRSILFALWDGEEKGLLGSKHWVANPTISMSRVKFYVNVDMIGRLSKGGLEIYGIRTSSGLRRLVSTSNRDSNVDLKFTWEMKDNSDHYTFFRRKVPVLMLHTGLHSDYHRPSDDAHKVNVAGMESVSRLLFQIGYDLSESPRSFAFRSRSQYEAPGNQRRLETPLAARKPRLGVWMEKPTDGKAGLVLTKVQFGSAAKRAGLRAGDRIIKFAGKEIESSQQFVSEILQAPTEAEAIVMRTGQEEPLTVTLKLDGSPVRIGIAWRHDSNEPGVALLTQVVSGSPAYLAGLRVRDRIYSVDGRQFKSSDDLLQLVTTLPSPLEMLIERRGRLFPVKLELPSPVESKIAAGE